MLAAEDEQLSLTDPDARSMATSGRGSGLVGYNVQAAIETKHHLIVAHEVTNQGHDRAQLSNMGLKAKEALDVEKLEAVTDRGYFNNEEIKACEDAGITPYLPRPQISTKRTKGYFSKDDFIYHEKEDQYECPAGQRLVNHMEMMPGTQKLYRYWTNVCGRCPLKAKCTPGRERRITRWEHEDVIDRLQTRLDENPHVMRVRRETAEHPFGTIKGWAGPQHFKMKTLKHVSTEMSLHVLAYNLKRVINLFGTVGWIAKMQAA
jgi:hypothetical protein